MGKRKGEIRKPKGRIKSNQIKSKRKKKEERRRRGEGGERPGSVARELIPCGPSSRRIKLAYKFPDGWAQHRLS